MKKLETRIKLCEKLMNEEPCYNSTRLGELDIGYGKQIYTVIFGYTFLIITKEDFSPFAFGSLSVSESVPRILKSIPQGNSVLINDSLLRQIIKDAPKGATNYAPVRIGGKKFNAKFIGQAFDIAGAWDTYIWYTDPKRYNMSLITFDKGMIIMCPMVGDGGIDVEEKE